MKTYDVYLLPDAITDLEDIYNYIAEKSGFSKRAWNYIEKLRQRCNELAYSPLRGQQRNDLMENLRILPLDTKSVVAFVVDEARAVVLVLNIFYGGRDYEALLGSAHE